MHNRQHHKIYQDNMVLAMHGFPQFSADPAGNSSLKAMDRQEVIEIGDLGYFK
jgi:hypothetical protein